MMPQILDGKAMNFGCPCDKYWMLSCHKYLMMGCNEYWMKNRGDSGCNGHILGLGVELGVAVSS